ncbi:3,4-dihydroxy-2-butanone-4-phosphate synthase [Desulfobacter latus]|uniref:3,4-dihydroxy-2-butanone 4-phosphate synthase n=1 Tax=Desulfobacter latus TaxID=2292 RepID=A0A850SU45_9BACT|nr:3,4-dihydroxy-2-butanone-4-phosphate synthase [Desulfobacter latus]NWH04679.1 3,4-dihydroxy-2-butanone-4-phosphate synthase [Desulfobacter latus]
MNQNPLKQFGNSRQRLQAGLEALRRGSGILVADDENRENEVDLIFGANTLKVEQMAMLIRECSGIVCLCLPQATVTRLNLFPMVKNNTSQYQTAFTVSIEAAEGVTTGVSARDRLTTIQAAVAKDAVPEDLNCPGHIFPLQAKPGGVLERAGHTEATVDLMTLAGLPPYGVLCELTNPDGSMARLLDAAQFAIDNDFTMLTVEDIINHKLGI